MDVDWLHDYCCGCRIPVELEGCRQPSQLSAPSSLLSCFRGALLAANNIRLINRWPTWDSSPGTTDQHVEQGPFSATMPPCCHLPIGPQPSAPSHVSQNPLPILPTLGLPGWNISTINCNKYLRVCVFPFIFLCAPVNKHGLPGCCLP